MKKIKLRFYIMIIFVFIFSAFFINYKSTYGIYRDTLNTKVYLSVLDPSATATVTYISDNTTYDTDSFPVNSTIGVLPKPDKTGYNFIGWYTEDGTRKIGPNEIITGDVRFIAHWAKIVCKKVTNMNKLHTETCSSGGGCTVSGTGYSTSSNSNSNTITYGTIYDDNSPKVGDAYDCDVYYDDVFDIKDTSNVRYSERFYYIRKKDNQGSEPTAVLVYYTSVDENGRVDSTTTTNDVGAYTYNQAETYLPTSSTWDNPGLINFDGNGTVSRFITFDDLNAICGPVTTSTSYFKNCKKWFLFETSRFQSGSKARAGIWISKNNNEYYRIQTSTLSVNSPENGANSSNMVRPVIEIPFTQIDGYSEKNIYTISFETNDSNSSMPHITRYEDQKIGMLDVPPTREGYRFVGWFYDNNTFQNEVSQNDTVTGNTPIYAKWELDTVNLEYVFHIPGECTFNGDAAITSSSNNCISTVNHTNSNIDYTDNTNSEYNQTSNKYINTHVSLYNNDNYDKDYEVGFTIVDMDLSNEKSQASLFNTKLEYNDNNYNYPGLVFRIKSATHFEISQTSNKVNTKLPIQSSNITSASPVDVKIMRKSGVISYIFNGGQEKVVQTLSGDYDHFAFPAWFGAASQAAGLNDTTAGAFRYIKGTLSNMYIKLENSSTHNVTFNGEGGTVSISPNTIKVSHGSSIGSNNMPTASKTGYNFNGWWTQSLGGQHVYGNEAILSDGIIYHAQYKNIYYITFDAVDGLVNGLQEKTIDVAEGDSIGTSNMPTASKAGYHFSGWYSQSSSGGTKYNGTEIISDDDRYYAQYKKIHTVAFDADGGTLSIAPNSGIDVIDGNSIGTSNMPTATKAGYKFIGWYSQTGTGGTHYDGTEAITSDNIVYYAQYKKSHAVTFDPDGGVLSITPNTSINVIDGESIGTSNMPTARKSGYTFAGWYSQTGTGGTHYDGTETITSDNIVYYAQWTAIVGPVRTVTFYDTDLQTVYGSVDVEDGTSLDVLMINDPTKANYIFDGWYISGTMLPFTSETVIENGNVNVVAKWKATVNIATITTTPTPFTVKVGSTGQIILTGPNGETVEDCNYFTSDANIATTESTGSVFGEGTGVVNITITGKTSGQSRTIQLTVHNNHTITFDPDNGDPVTEIIVTNGSTIGANVPNDPTKTNYIFDRWYYYDGTTLTSTPVDTAKQITRDETYKASWAANNMVAAIGNSYYPTIADAISQAPNKTETEVRIIQDIPNITCTNASSGTACNIDGRTTVPSNKIIAINGGNHTISCGNSTDKNVIYVNGGTLKIKSGTFNCSAKADIAVFETTAQGKIYIEGGIVKNTNNRSAIYNLGTVYVQGGEIYTGPTVNIRAVIQNADAGANIIMSGGTVRQEMLSAAEVRAKGAIQILAGTRATITGGTIISYSKDSAAIDNAGTLVIGTSNGTYSPSSPIIQGEYYGINSTKKYSLYDGIIKGKENNQAVNDFSKIDETNGIEPNSTRVTSTEGNYYTLYYSIPQTKYKINFVTERGTVSNAYIDYNLGETITISDLATATDAVYHFDGWYTNPERTTPFTTFTPSVAGEVTYYAKWSYVSSLTPVSHNVLSNAMVDYFDNVATWESADISDPTNDSINAYDEKGNYDNGHHLFKTSINNVFTQNSCSDCNDNNGCSNPLTGTYCDQPKGYQTGLNDDLNVYIYENGQHSNTTAPYITSTNGVIYNMIPGVTYYWESQNDNSIYGVVSATSGTRRTIKNSTVRNLRDLGGLSVSYEDPTTHQTVTGIIEYGRLYRGTQITSAQSVTELNNLGITREIDVRPNGEGNQSFKLNNYDTGTKESYSDIQLKNYIINYGTTPYISVDHQDNYADFKNALRKVMEMTVNNHDNIFFHCKIGSDRTGTLAYFLEGLLGVSETDRLRDYELTYFYGLTNRTRFHDTVNWSNINPRFYSMYKSYPTNQSIYNYYKMEEYVPGPGEMTDDELLEAFRNEVIRKNSNN